MAERPERDADVQTIEHRRRRGYSASPSTMVKTLTRESTDGHRNGPILVGRTPGHIRWCSSDPPGSHPPSDIPHAGNWSNGCRRVSGPTRWISWKRDEQPRHNPSDKPAALSGMWIGARCGVSIQFAGPDDMQAVIPSPALHGGDGRGLVEVFSLFHWPEIDRSRHGASRPDGGS